jgi:hypothetical protein
MAPARLPQHRERGGSVFLSSPLLSLSLSFSFSPSPSFSFFLFTLAHEKKEEKN